MNRLIDAIQKPGPRDLDCDRSDPNVGVFHAQGCLQIGCSFYVFRIVLMLVSLMGFYNRVQETSILISVTLMSFRSDKDSFVSLNALVYKTITDIIEHRNK